MHQAFASPVFRSLAVGGLLLALTVGAYAKRSHHGRHMVLHAVDVPGEVYLSVFRDGPISVPFDGEDLLPLSFHTVASVSDGCRWLGIETLEPVGGDRYAYRYDERILECDPDAVPCYRTPRTGLVTIEP
jgi:hypothetical protein